MEWILGIYKPIVGQGQAIEEKGKVKGFLGDSLHQNNFHMEQNFVCYSSAPQHGKIS